MAVENVTKISIDTPEEPAEIGAIERSTSELVIGLVGAVGAGVSTTAKELATLLSRDYGYGEVTIVKISDIIRANAEKVLVDVPAVISPFLMGLSRRIHAAVFSFIAGVLPPMPMLGLSLL